MYNSDGSEFVVVDNVSLNAYEDQITVLLGPNGSGKTAILNMITGNHGINRILENV